MKYYNNTTHSTNFFFLAIHADHKEMFRVFKSIGVETEKHMFFFRLQDCYCQKLWLVME